MNGIDLSFVLGKLAVVVNPLQRASGAEALPRGDSTQPMLMSNPFGAFGGPNAKDYENGYQHVMSGGAQGAAQMDRSKWGEESPAWRSGASAALQSLGNPQSPPPGPPLKTAALGSGQLEPTMSVTMPISHAAYLALLRNDPEGVAKTAAVKDQPARKVAAGPHPVLVALLANDPVGVVKAAAAVKAAAKAAAMPPAKKDLSPVAPVNAPSGKPMSMAKKAAIKQAIIANDPEAVTKLAYLDESQLPPSARRTAPSWGMLGGLGALAVGGAAGYAAHQPGAADALDRLMHVDQGPIPGRPVHVNQDIVTPPFAVDGHTIPNNPQGDVPGQEHLAPGAPPVYITPHRFDLQGDVPHRFDLQAFLHGEQQNSPAGMPVHASGFSAPTDPDMARRLHLGTPSAASDAFWGPH